MVALHVRPLIGSATIVFNYLYLEMISFKYINSFQFHFEQIQDFVNDIDNESAVSFSLFFIFNPIEPALL